MFGNNKQVCKFCSRILICTESAIDIKETVLQIKVPRISEARKKNELAGSNKNYNKRQTIFVEIKSTNLTARSIIFTDYWRTNLWQFCCHSSSKSSEVKNLSNCPRIWIPLYIIRMAFPLRSLKETELGYYA